MKLMDKIKDLFMDEVDSDEDIELEEEEKEEYKEPPKEELPKVMRDYIEEEKKVEKVDPEEFIRESRKSREKEEIIEEKKEEAKPKKFTFPIDFDDEVKESEKKEEVLPKKRAYDIESDYKNNFGNGNINVLNLEKETTRKTIELYPTKEEDIKPKFKASPVISPVYGILDKNYTKEEVREKSEDETMKRPSKKVDFETVRKKAFGNLADEIKDNMLCENCELYKEVKKISALKEDDLLYDMTVDEDKDLTIEKAYDNYEEFGVAYEPKKSVHKVEVSKEEVKVEDTTYDIPEDDTKLDDIISKTHDVSDESAMNDVMLEDKIDDFYEEKADVTEKPIINSEFTSKKEENDKVDEDFFELIDSMYKERSEE